MCAWLDRFFGTVTDQANALALCAAGHAMAWHGTWKKPGSLATTIGTIHVAATWLAQMVAQLKTSVSGSDEASATGLQNKSRLRKPVR